jgi:hypothetical protein
MEAAVKAALIALGGTGLTVAGTLIGAFREEIRDALSFSSTHQNLKGKWTAHWEITSPAGDPMTDEVQIEKVSGTLVKGKGSTALYGEYLLEGKAGDFVVTLSYDGVDKKKGLAGVVILQKVTLTKLKGVWCQYSDGILKSGTTAWEKK